MYQLDSWYAVLFELLIVGFSLYNSLRMTKWWDTVAEGTAISVRGARNVPSVADYYGIQTAERDQLRSRQKRNQNLPEMGDGVDVR